MGKKGLKAKIMKKLEQVQDPELFISIVDLGLIYQITVENGRVDIKMTLTTIGCPIFPVIEGDIREKLGEIGGVQEVNIDLVFDPPWSMDKMSEKAKAQIGI